jgi:hypothetical protein
MFSNKLSSTVRLIRFFAVGIWPPNISVTPLHHAFKTSDSGAKPRSFVLPPMLGIISMAIGQPGSVGGVIVQLWGHELGERCF